MIHPVLVHWPMRMQDDCSMIGLEVLVLGRVPCPTIWLAGELERRGWAVLVVPAGCRDGASTVVDRLRMTWLR